MVRIDFNKFKGFDLNEDILIDTNVLYAFLDINDPWHITVNNLFENHIFKELKCLYINPCILVEATNLLRWEKSFKRYSDRNSQLGITESQCIRVENAAIQILRKFIETKILDILGFDKEAMLCQLDLYKRYGPTDAANLSIANQHGISILTVDNRLVDTALVYSRDIPNIEKIYCTTNDHMKLESQ